MYLINRAVAIVKPRQPFLEWLSRMPDPPQGLTLDELREDCTAFLIPEPTYQDEAEGFVEEIYDEIFEIELNAWYTHEALWPPHRDYKMFLEWFDVEIHSMVIDSQEDEIEAEEYHLSP